jgi:hypothetical protein
MKKLRIVKMTDGNNDVTYKVQGKGLLWWGDFGAIPMGAFICSASWRVSTYKTYAGAVSAKANITKHKLSLQIKEEVM